MFRNDKSREAFETLNCKRKIWAEHAVILDEINPAIRANFESRGWLSLLEIDHPPPTALIREFFLNLSCHVYDSNTFVRSCDGDQGITSKDLVQVPIGSVARARAKKFKDVLNGLIQELWAQANS